MHQVGVLADERVPPALRRPGGEPVRAEPLGTRSGLGRAETGLLVYLNLYRGERGNSARRAIVSGPVVIVRPSNCAYSVLSASRMKVISYARGRDTVGEVPVGRDADVPAD